MALKAETKVGFFVFITVVIFVVFVFAIGGHSWKSNNTYHSVFGDVAGLKEKSAVKYAGKKVGIVKEIRFVNRSPQEIFEVDFDVERDIKIREGSVTLIDVSMLTKEAILEIKPGDKDSIIKPDAAIPSKTTIGLNEILEEVQGAMKSLNSGGLGSLLGEESKGKIDEILGDVKAAVLDLKFLMKNSREVVEENKPKLNEAFSNLRDFSGDVKGTVQENRPDIRDTIKNLKDVSASLDKRVDPILVKLDKFITDLKQISGDNKKDIRETIKNLAKTGKNFKEFSEDIKKNPWKLLSKPRKKKRRR